ncbi:DMT family transporter [Vibrio tapetis]|uniref:EamA domain-containing protein n=1 Tax=Vibrio tapetis subsp. tapetis TaxID=1671868 RepID=A0A2N8ZET9_9VIBR|nr:DMT family transporter [Vibrio tapetis]SON50437.1 conserved membrane protein of unknown function [Vibrio tapetis subsp. tapetis]
MSLSASHPEQSNHQMKAITFMLISTFNLSLTGLLTKNLTDIIHYDLLILLRFLIPALFMVWLLAITEWQSPDRATLPALVLRALFITLTQVCFLYALAHLSLMESVVLFSTGPLFIPLLEKIIFGTPLNHLTIIALLMAFVGVAIQSGIKGNIDWRPELLIGVASGVFNPASQVCMYRSTKSQLSSLALNTWCMVFASVFAFVLFAGLQGNDILNVHNGDLSLSTLLLQNVVLDNDWIWAVIAVLLMSVTTINTQVFRAKAYRLVSTGSILAPLIFTNLVFATLWQVMFFNFEWQPHTIMGMILIVSATMLHSLGPKAQRFWVNKSKEDRLRKAA